jgi:hypothetical protein
VEKVAYWNGCRVLSTDFGCIAIDLTAKVKNGGAIPPHLYTYHGQRFSNYLTNFTRCYTPDNETRTPSYGESSFIVLGWGRFWVSICIMVRSPGLRDLRVIQADMETSFYTPWMEHIPKSKLLYDWRSVSQYVLVSSTLVGLATRYYFLSECCCLKFAVLYLLGALSEGRTGLQFAVQSLNGPSRAEPLTILYCLIWDSPNLERRLPYLYPPGTGWPSYTPRALGSLYVVSYDSQGYGGGS